MIEKNNCIISKLTLDGHFKNMASSSNFVLFKYLAIISIQKF